jgi:hypothetical protein
MKAVRNLSFKNRSFQIMRGDSDMHWPQMRKPIWETSEHNIWVERIENGMEAFIMVTEPICDGH